MIKKICNEIYKITGSKGVNLYFLDLGNKVLVDTGDFLDRDMIVKDLSSVTRLDDIDTVIFTDLSYEQIGNFEIFKNARFYASKQAIEDLQSNKFNVILSNILADSFNVELHELNGNDMFSGLKIIWAPGHTRGSICIWYEKERMMFTGETMLDYNYHTHLEMPTSAADLFESTLNDLEKYQIKILCPGRNPSYW